MSTNVEIEAKILVTETEFATLCAFLQVGEKDAIPQTNYYIDTPNSDLRKYGFSLRIRQRLDQYTLTLKSPLAEGILEKNQPVTKKQLTALQHDGTFPHGTVTDFLLSLGFPIEQLTIRTSLTTWRIDTTYEERSLSLDKNVYSGITDYEVESEQSAIVLAAETLKKLCHETGITYRPNKISKHARALRALG